jgi:hypothetical protein
MEQDTVVQRPVGMELRSLEQDTGLVMNPDPDSVTMVPIPPLVGVTTSLESTMNLALPTSFVTDPGKSPVKVRV